MSPGPQRREPGTVSPGLQNDIRRLSTAPARVCRVASRRCHRPSFRRLVRRDDSVSRLADTFRHGFSRLVIRSSGTSVSTAITPLCRSSSGSVNGFAVARFFCGVRTLASRLSAPFFGGQHRILRKTRAVVGSVARYGHANATSVTATAV